MSEYWKSTPKYWCKHCKTFVRDTKLEKTNHEATPKHQGNLKRFLRDLHKGHERDERDKQRAKDEVDRLNGAVSASSSKSGSAPWERRSAMPSASAGVNQQATPADRKRQLAQLAEMGVAVPEDFRREMAMAGDWQILSEKVVYNNDSLKKEEYNEDVKPSGLSMGVRKRRFEGQEEEEAGEPVVKKGWGSTIRTYPGAKEDDDDLDTLLGTTKRRVVTEGEGSKPLGSGRSFRSEQANNHVPAKGSNPGLDLPAIKQEDHADSGVVAETNLKQTADVEHSESVKREEDPPDSGVLFKKRKAKPIRQR